MREVTSEWGYYSLPGLSRPVGMAHEAFENAGRVREFIRKKLKAD